MTRQNVYLGWKALLVMSDMDGAFGRYDTLRYLTLPIKDGMDSI